MSIVRENLLKDRSCTPYCGNDNCGHHWPRTTFNGSQFSCQCGWRSSFPADFIAQVKAFRASSMSVTPTPQDAAQKCGE